MISLIGLSMIIGNTTSWIFDRPKQKISFPIESLHHSLPRDFQFWLQAKQGKKRSCGTGIFSVLSSEKAWKALKQLFAVGVTLASDIQAIISLGMTKTYFSPTLLGLDAASIAEDIMTSANSPRSSFAFLMAAS